MARCTWKVVKEFAECFLCTLLTRRSPLPLHFCCIQLRQATVAPKQMRSLMKASISSLNHIMSTFKDALCSISTQN